MTDKTLLERLKLRLDVTKRRHPNDPMFGYVGIEIETLVEIIEALSTSEKRIQEYDKALETIQNSTFRGAKTLRASARSALTRIRERIT